jgi:hypothetical protein
MRPGSLTYSDVGAQILLLALAIVAAVLPFLALHGENVRSCGLLRDDLQDWAGTYAVLLAALAGVLGAGEYLLAVAVVTLLVALAL